MKLAAVEKQPGFGEFVALMAMLTSLVALSIDAMLPALDGIGIDLQVAHQNDTQKVVSVLFLGLGLGQLLYGPLSDSYGRKPMIYWGLGIYVIGTLVAIYSATFSMMLLGRFLQGFGGAAARIVSMALIRDCYEGRQMARVMSFIMVVFILVPALAPLLGQGILFFAEWHAIFWVCLLFALFVWVWFAWRQPETLPQEQRQPFSFYQLRRAFLAVATQRSSMAYTVIMGFVFGAFVGYLASAQKIFQDLYQLGEQFPLYFGLLALFIGLSSLVNSHLVTRFGMRRLSLYALLGMCLFTTLFLGYAFIHEGRPSLTAFMVCFIFSFFCIGLLFGNLTSLAMEPLGAMAGMGASVVSALSTFISVPLGGWIAQSYNGTVFPLVIGFSCLSFVGFIGVYLLREVEP